MPSESMGPSMLGQAEQAPELRGQLPDIVRLQKAGASPVAQGSSLPPGLSPFPELTPLVHPSVDAQFTELVRPPALPGATPKAFASLTRSYPFPLISSGTSGPSSVRCTNSPPRTVATTFTLRSSSGSASRMSLSKMAMSARYPGAKTPHSLSL
jgi:hypothetical protein